MKGHVGRTYQTTEPYSAKLYYVKSKKDHYAPWSDGQLD